MRPIDMRLAAVFLLALPLADGIPAAAQTQPAAPAGASSLPQGVDVAADSLEYDADQKVWIASGNVTVSDTGATLQADYMTIQTETQDVLARGHVIYKGEGRTWQGDELRYNLKTRMGDFGPFKAHSPPYYITAEDSKRVSTNQYLLSGVTLTTCAGDKPAFRIRAREATLTDGNKIRAKGVVMHLGPIPIFYLPALKRTLGPHPAFFQTIPGYSDRMGAFILGAYHYPVAEGVRGVTHLDLRSKRGVGVGQDLTWKSTNDTFSGDAQVYYANDQEPLEGPESEGRTEDNVDSDRYRLRLSHSQAFTPRDYLLANVDYLSDAYVEQDFFDEDFRDQVQPENRLTLTHRADKFTAAIQVNKRLNDFYENVDRVPELTLDVPTMRLGQTPAYYQSENSVAQLERVFPDGSKGVDYDSGRFDTAHQVSLPTRHFGFLNFIPRAGYRATYYSTTYEQGTETVTSFTTNDTGAVSAVTRTNRVALDVGSDTRSLFELGFENSLKGFKTWDDLLVLNGGDGLRHVAEPYLNYTYVPEPNLRPFELPQFDDIDRLDRRNDVQLGMRNKLQTRRSGRTVDLVDADIYTYYRFDPEETEEDFSDIIFDTELRLSDRFPIDFDGAFDTYEGEFSQFSTQMAYVMTDQSTASLEYRYRRDDQDLISGELVLFPNSKWSVRGYWRYDFELSELEEQTYFLQTRNSCMGYGLGFKQVDEDSQIWLQIWVLAFPGGQIKLGG
jgi:LPS-assembly protein